jgi:hypothetical protein
MVAYAWDLVQRGNAVGLFGMIHVLEGVSARGAAGAAESLRRSLGLPAGAVRCLSSHGELDQGHVASFDGPKDRLDEEVDRSAVLHASRVSSAATATPSARFRSAPSARVAAAVTTRRSLALIGTTRATRHGRSGSR